MNNLASILLIIRGNKGSGGIGMSTRTTPSTVVLVGPGQQENLPLAYLGASLIRAGHRPVRVRFDNAADRNRCIEAILSLRPAVVGISMAFQFAVTPTLELIEKLRSRGFAGHITCGGHVATFCYEDLLAGCPGLDSVIRHEGEQTMVALVDALAEGRDLRGIPGLVGRGAGGIEGADTTAPVQPIDALPEPMRPRRLFQIGGVPVSFLLTSRGCVGECRYCSISAFNRSAGGPPYRLRDPEKVAAEVAALYYEQDARVFFVQDDLFILPREHATLSRIHALRSALSRRGVNDAMFWIKGRPETITRDVLLAAREMGARHLFLGIEHAVDARLQYLGRRHGHRDNLQALRLCREAEIRTSFNLMIFDPSSSLDDVDQVMAFAGQCPELPWNICRTEIYPGTALFHQLQEEGRLQGDYRTYGYTMTDSRAEVLFRILRVGMHEHAFHVDSLLNRLIAVSMARQIHERFLPGESTRRVSEAVDHLIVEAHEDTIREIRDAMRFVRGLTGTDFAPVRRYAAEQAERLSLADHKRFTMFQQLWDHLSARGETLLGRRSEGLHRSA